MLENIAPGDKVTVKIVKQPTNEAARKTLQRVLSKDEAAKAENKRQSKVRESNFRTKQRGGRQWARNVVKQHAVAGTVGETGTILASTDVIRDLGSVQRFVEVEKA